eukprot:Ihof_evm1s1314 gene=Ihof_evmTU1s1314
MILSTRISMVDRALRVILLMGITAGYAQQLNVRMPRAHNITSVDIQVPPECIYRHDAAPAELPSIMYPLYYSDPHYDSTTGVCTDTYIKNLSKGCKSILAVVNPGSGPAIFNSGAYHGYQACTRLLGKNGVQMVGYVKTKVAHKLADGVWRYDGVRDMPSIKKDIDQWYDHFRDVPNFKGIFVDETSNYYEIFHGLYNVNHIEIYQELLAAAPGFPEPADISIPWEDYAWRWKPEGNNCTIAQSVKTQGNWGIGPWCKYVPKLDHVEEFKKGVTNGTFKAAAFLH